MLAVALVIVQSIPITERTLMDHTGAVTAVTAVQLDGRTVAVSGSDDNTLRVWDLTTSAPIGEPFAGHEGDVSAVITAQLGGRPVIISGSNDGTLRTWDHITRTSG